MDRLSYQTDNLAGEIEEVYSKFFSLIDEQIIGRVHGYASGVPPLLQGYMGREPEWAELSGAWLDRKQLPRKGSFNEHPQDMYQGLTAYYGVASPARLKNKKAGGASRKKGVRGGASTLSFQQYIKQLASDPHATDKFFGPVQIEYALAERSRNFKVMTEDNIIQEIDSFSKKTGKYLMFPREFTLRSTVTAFPKLNGVEFSEWYVVDYIIKRLDPANEKQWVKINSRYGFGKRPMRAIITPLITWYGKAALAQAMISFKGSLHE